MTPLKWIIKDWTGKTCFNGKEFDYFSDAWDFIYQTCPEDDEKSYDDYFVVIY
jgi:hypothetical protein